MIHEPNKQVLQALSRLIYIDDFKTVNTWLKSEMNNISIKNDNELNEVLLRRGQGAALLLRQYFKIQDNAEDTLTAMRDKRE